MRRDRKKREVVQAPLLFDLGTDRVAEVTQKRGQIVSALMKAIRLAREEDAVYWMLALLRGGQDRSYLGRRCFGSACEDNFNIEAIEMASSLAKRPAKAELPYFHSVIASCRGAKWYEPAAREYTLARIACLEGPRRWKEESDQEVTRIALAAFDRQEYTLFFAAKAEMFYRKKNMPLSKALIEAAGKSERPEVQRLRRTVEANLWYCVTRDWFPLWQLAWTLWRGPLTGALDPVDLTGAAEAIAAAEARWAASVLEPVPSWCLDGIHTIGTDPRFAGDPRGVRNMCAMFDRYGRLHPDDEGIVVKAGEGGGRRKGLWPVRIESMTEPGVFYEVEPDGDALSCSCPAYRWWSRRGAPSCQHVRRLLEENPGILDLG